jgi:hypothetical protein
MFKEKYDLETDGIHVFEQDGKIYIEDEQEKIEWDGDWNMQFPKLIGL